MFAPVGSILGVLAVLSAQAIAVPSHLDARETAPNATHANGGGRNTTRNDPGSRNATALDGDLWDFKKDTWDIWVNFDCSKEQVGTIQNAWAEAGYLAHALRKWDPVPDNLNSPYQDSMDLYMGKDSIDNGGPGQTSWLQRLRDNIHREYNIHTNNVGWGNYITVYCKEETVGKDVCSKDGVLGYAWDDPGWFAYHNMLLCGKFFNGESSEDLETMASQIAEIRNDIAKASFINNLFLNRAFTMLHESLHWEVLVSKPRINDSPDSSMDDIYGPYQIRDAASKFGARGMSIVAEAYALVATSNFMKDTFKLDKAPIPDPKHEPGKQRPGLVQLDEPPSNYERPSLDVVGAKPAANKWYTLNAAGATIDAKDYLPIS